MKKQEKNTILLALVSAIRYHNEHNKKYNLYGVIDKPSTKEIISIYYKLLKKYYKDEKTKNDYIEYLNTILKEIESEEEKRKKESTIKCYDVL